MKLLSAATILPAYIYGLRIEVNGDVAALPDTKATQPIMQSFAQHLHSVAGLFSSIIGQGNPSGSSFYNPACYLPEKEDSEFPNWSGPFCLISYDSEKTCGEEFNCNFVENFDVQLPNESKLCCRNPDEPWSSKFQEYPKEHHAFRVFSANKQEKLPSNGEQFEGHYSLNEIIFNARVKPDAELYLNKFDMGSACKVWGEELGYYTLDPVPQNGDYDSKSEVSDLEVCAMERKFDVAHNGAEVPSIMPFCSFKISGQSCPDYAPLYLTFPKSVLTLPNDNLYQSNSFIDSTGLCCSVTEHKTVDQTIVNLDYLPANWTMNDFQVIRWPYAKCPIFEFPKMDLSEEAVEFLGNSEYPWSFSDLKFSMCKYKQAEPVVTEENDVTAATENSSMQFQPTSVGPAFAPNGPESEELIELDTSNIESQSNTESVAENSGDGALEDEEEYQHSLMPKLVELHAKYSEYKSNDKYEVNPFDTNSTHTKLFRNRRAGCYFSTTEAFCNGKSSPFVQGLQICCDPSNYNALDLASLWTKPYPDDFFMIRGDKNDECVPVKSQGNESVIRQEVVFEYEDDVLQLNACIYTVVDESAIVYTTPASTVVSKTTSFVEVRPLMGYIKTNSFDDCDNPQSSLFQITQDTEDHPIDIADCSQSWIDHLTKPTANLEPKCSSEGHGLVTWEICMGEFPEFGKDYENSFTVNPAAKDNQTTGFCFVKAAVVTCPDGYMQRSIKWKNEMNGNQNNYEFRRPSKPGVVFEKIWPGGYFGPGPELQIDFCCKEVLAMNVEIDLKDQLDRIQENLDIIKTSLTDSNSSSLNDVLPQPMMIEKLGDEKLEENDYHDFRIGLVRFGDFCPLVDGNRGLDAWFDFPTEKNNSYDSTGGIAEKSQYGIKLNVCLYI